MIIAHRGASAYAPENTMAAFELAIKQRADMIEMDAKLSADGHVVIIHDRTVDRTTNRSGHVSSFTLAELQGFDTGSHFDQKFSGEKILSLEEVLWTFGDEILLNIELSNYTSPFDALPDRVARLVNEFNCSTQIFVSSFHPIPLRRFRKLLPGIPLGFIARRGLSGSLSRSWLGKKIVPYQVIHVEKSDLSQELLARAHKVGKRVHTYTVNSVQEMKHQLSLGVDGIITDDPLTARQLLE